MVEVALGMASEAHVEGVVALAMVGSVALAERRRAST